MEEKTSLILVHLGYDTPFYLRDCLHQIRLWNSPEEVDIYLVAFPEKEETFIPLCSQYGVKFVSTTTLKKTIVHESFSKNLTNYDSAFRDDYWRYVIERFFYMEEVMVEFSIKAAIHMEYDVLVYMNLPPLSKKIKEHISGLALSFDNDTQGYPSFVVINDVNALSMLNGFFSVNCASGLTDMKLLSYFRKVYPTLMESLPQIPRKVFEANPSGRANLDGTTPQENPAYLANLFDELGEVIFDSLAIGQFVGGIDMRNTAGMCIIEYVNESSFYKVSEFGIEWRQDSEKRWYPVSRIENGNYRIVNIHLHSKMLSHFLSDRVDQPTYDYKNVQMFRVKTRQEGGNIVVE